MQPTRKTQCSECGEEVTYALHANFSIYCPKCGHCVHCECEFGYGPVTPYHFCIGDDVIAMAVSNENGYFLSYGNQTVKLEQSYLEAIKEAERILSKVWNTKPGWPVQ
ncbi:MAG: hypothetical protein HFE86_04710 [Clostridiales bacterium]|nr:hypothetical protein [Clostridiales bacterium]